MELPAALLLRHRSEFGVMRDRRVHSGGVGTAWSGRASLAREWRGSPWPTAIGRLECTARARGLESLAESMAPTLLPAPKSVCTGPARMGEASVRWECRG